MSKSEELQQHLDTTRAILDDLVTDGIDDEGDEFDQAKEIADAVLMLDLATNMLGDITTAYSDAEEAICRLGLVIS